MRSRNNTRAPVQRTDYVGHYAAYLQDARNAERIQREQSQQLLRRIRRMARVAVVAARHDITARQRRALTRKRRIVAGLRTMQQNQYRLVAGGFVLLLTLTTIISPFIQATYEKHTTLNSSVKALVGDSRDDTKDYLKYDSNKNVYTFDAAKQDTTGTYDHTGRNVDAYSATVPNKAGDGITVTENNTKIAVTLTPEFFTTPAQKSDGDHLVYQSGSRQVIYTLKYNGLKEDIIIPRFQGATLDYKFKLQLPSGVEARLDKDGNIGIYSADTSLYGNISFGSDADRAKVDKARENSAKTNLVMTIPYPVIKDSTGQEYGDRASFVLGEKEVKKIEAADTSLPPGAPKQTTQTNNYQLTLEAHNLKHLAYPISLDPTMQVASAADFSKLNAEYNNAEVDTTNSLIRRTTLSGGTLAAWGGNTSIGTAKHGAQAVAYNGYMYLIGGCTAVSLGNCSTVTNAVSYATISSAGVLGTFNPTATLTDGRYLHASVAYNGYVYALSGNDGNVTNNAEYAKIKSDGSLANWTPTNSTGSNALTGRAIAAYNGHIYLIGGYNSSESNSTQIATLAADGSILSWSNASNLQRSRTNTSGAVYNGYLYVFGGYSSTSDAGADHATYSVEYAKINSDGTIGAWAYTNNFATPRIGLVATMSEGYAYVAAGCLGGTFALCQSGRTNTVQYAPINVDGTIGTWRDTSTLANSTELAAGEYYNGYLFIMGGRTASGLIANTESTTIKPAGETTASATDTGGNFTTARFYHASIAYNGYLYISGGCTANSCLTPASDIQFAPINSDGSVGTWATATNTFSTGRYGHAMAAQNGYLYIIGGKSAVAELNDVQYAVINTDGTLGSFTIDTHSSFSARHSFAFVQNGGNFYVIGGRNGNTNLNDVWYTGTNGGATVNWVQDTSSSFTGARREFSAAIWGGYIYIVNGSDGTNVFNDVQYAKINSDNTLGTWIPTNTFGVGIYSHQVIATKGYLYLMGGCGGGGCSGYQTGTRYKKINSDGTLDSTTNSVPGTFSSSRMMYGAATYNDFLLTTGGCTGSTAADTTCTSIQGDTQYAAINNGGSRFLSTWTTETSLNTPRGEHSTVVYNGHIYVMGGCTSYDASFVCTRTDSIEYTKLASTGAFSVPSGCATTWCNSPTRLPEARRGLRSIAVNGYLYIIGGDTATGSTNSVRYVAINSDGSLGSTWLIGSSLLTARWHHAVAVSNGYVYAFAGRTSSTVLSDTEYARLNPDGSLGAWAPTGSSTIPNNSLGLYGHTLFAVGGKLYTTGGGFRIGADGRTSRVNFATINSDGTLGAWVDAGSFPWLFPRSARTWVLNGQVYYSNEWNDPITTVTLTSSGNLSTWEAANSKTTAPTQIDYSPGVSWGGNLYTIGGCSTFGTGSNYMDCSGVSGFSGRAKANSIPRVAQVSKLYDFDAGVNPTKLITRGTKQGGATVGVSYSTNNAASGTDVALSNLTSISDMGYGGANAQTLSLGTNRTLARYLFLSYTIDDSQSAVFPDAGNESTTTDFDLYYIPNPGNRLRSGNTFTNGASRGLDAQPQ